MMNITFHVFHYVHLLHHMLLHDKYLNSITYISYVYFHLHPRKKKCTVYSPSIEGFSPFCLVELYENLDMSGPEPTHQPQVEETKHTLWMAFHVGVVFHVCILGVTI